MKQHWLKRSAAAWLLLLFLLASLLSGCSEWLPDDGGNTAGKDTQGEDTQDSAVYGFASVEGVPDYAGKAYVELNGNQPQFTAEEITAVSYEYYSELDSLGRCGVTHACVGKDLMPTEDRESISSVKPTGWVNNKYSTTLVEGGYIYNRCHLIGFQLTGENANKQNLITGTRYLNIEGMLPFENMVADYVKETGHHVMYRVTPVFVGNNLLASGVRIEGWSVEDEGDSICFCVFAYNVQPGITIDYATGRNWLNGEANAEPADSQTSAESGTAEYVINTKTKTFHLPTCSSASGMKEENKEISHKTKEELVEEGYTPCGSCKP